jgi:hypothetical protein
MADDDKGDDTRAEKNIKRWVNEVLDERKTKEDAERTALEDKAKKDAEENKPVPWFDRFFGG